MQTPSDSESKPRYTIELEIRKLPFPSFSKPTLPAPPHLTFQSLVTSLVLLAIVAIGAFLRFTGQNWDLGQRLHPDETFIVSQAVGIRWPDSIGQYFDTTNSPLNPFNVVPTFVYGTFPLFLDKALAGLSDGEIWAVTTRAFRTLSAVFDLAGIVLLFLVGCRLFGRATGLLAALLYALTVFAIQASHFGTFDLIAAQLCLLAFYLALRATSSRRWITYAMLGIVAGLAISSRLNALTVIAFVLLPLAESFRSTAAISGWRTRLAALRPSLVRTVFALALVAVTVRIALPYAFAGPGFFDLGFDPRWKADFDYWRGIQSGKIDYYPSVQWAHRTPFAFTLKNLLIWGLGPALGIASMLGLGLLLWHLLRARRWPPIWMLLLAGWPLFYILYVSVSFLQNMRYLAPAYPFLVLLAAAFLVTAASYLRRRVPRRPWLAIVPAALVVVPTAIWALAFTSIYTHDTTRITASQWVYANVPPGSTLLTEHWDVDFPLPVSANPGRQDYTIVQLPLYDPDNESKLDFLMQQLEQGDYIMITSTRLYKSIPRIPERYPMSIAYYDALFDGSLGFEKVATFTSFPQLFGIEIDDSSAEEAFTVFDHPSIMIFRKTGAFDPTAVRTMLQSALDTDIVQVTSATAGLNMMQMSDEERAIQQAGGTWSTAFDRDGIGSTHPVITWYLALQIIALLALPLSWRVLGGLPDRGYAASKTIGILLVSTIAWLISSYRLMGFGRGSVVVSMVVLALLSLAAVWRWRNAFLPDLRERWRWILVAEVVFLAAFLTMAYLRSRNPELWNPDLIGEKEYELAFFTAIAKSTHFPPYDPWFAGGYINYYYFGWVMWAVIARLLGTVPAVAFNMAVVSIVALCMLNAWAFVSSLLWFFRRRCSFRWSTEWVVLAGGLLGPLFFGISSNFDLSRRIATNQWAEEVVTRNGPERLGMFGDVIDGVFHVLTGRVALSGPVFWRPSRIIPFTINEFPYFTFLFADLHPHLMAMPFTLLALIGALAIIMPPLRTAASVPVARPTPEHSFSTVRLRNWCSRWLPRVDTSRAWMIGLAAVITGVLYPLNTWDYPTYLVVTAGAFLLADCLGSSAAERGQNPRWSFGFVDVRRAVLSVAAVFALGRLIFQPYYAHYLSQIGGFERFDQRTPTSLYLLIFGLFVFLIVSYLVLDLVKTGPSLAIHRGATATAGGLRFSSAIVPVVLSLGAATVAIVTGELMWLLLGWLVLVGCSMLLHGRDALRLFILGLTGLGIGLSIFVERFHLLNDDGRLNTVFKIHLQVWMLLSLIAALALVLLIVSRELTPPIYISAPWSLVLVLLLVGAFTYPIYATESRLNDRIGAEGRTLDGSAYMSSAAYQESARGLPPEDVQMASDLAAIRWMQDNIQGSPVVLEADAEEANWNWRVSINTGLPTVIGWDWQHEGQQRPGFHDLIDERQRDVQTMLGERRSFENIQPLLDKYHVEYIYIGPLERIYYNADALKKFEIAAEKGLLDVVYDQDGVTIYRYQPANSDPAG